jgi:hypothetical protein
MVSLKFIKGEHETETCMGTNRRVLGNGGFRREQGFFKTLRVAGLAAYDEAAGIQWNWLSADGAGNGGVTKGRGEEQAEHRNGCYLRISPKSVGSIFRFRQIPVVF